MGFRYFIKELAEEYSLVGWVKNNQNGKVEGVLQGAEENLTQVEILLARGVPGSTVIKLEIVRIPENKGLKKFTLLV